MLHRNQSAAPKDNTSEMIKVDHSVSANISRRLLVKPILYDINTHNQYSGVWKILDAIKRSNGKFWNKWTI